MTETKLPDANEPDVPLFKTWRAWYILIIVFLLLLIGFFYFFTKQFS